jgi:polysaccharide pyruvyl transferase WcaK-like protein
MSRTKGDILLLGSYGRGNLGDDAFLLAALKLFKGHRLFINSANDELLPQAVQGKVTTIATSGSHDFMQKIKVFRQIEHIVYCGGDLWVELYGDRFPRQSLYKMVIVNLIARICGKKVHYVGCGIGKLSGYSLFLARLSARLAQGIVVREPRSARVLNLKKIRVLPDLVTNLDITTARKRQKGKYTIGVSILYYLPDPEKNFPRLIKNLSKSLGRLPADQYRIVLFPMLSSPTDDHDDVWASEQLQATLPGLEVSMFTGREVDDYVTALRDVDVLIGTRLHANIIALLAGVPTLGISYRTKVAQFFEMSKLGDYCIDLDEVTPELLSAKLQDIQDNHKTVMGRISEARNQNLEERKGYQDFVATYL